MAKVFFRGGGAGGRGGAGLCRRLQEIDNETLWNRLEYDIEKRIDKQGLETKTKTKTQSNTQIKTKAKDHSFHGYNERGV